MNHPAVSVVIPAYNQHCYLREAIASALSQSVVDLEVIIVDDGSTDATRSICESFDDPRLQYVYQINDGTKGLGARNHAMLRARGTWIALLDQDDRWHPCKLERQLAQLASCPTAGAAFCRVCFIDDSGRAIGTQEGPLPTGDVLHLLLSANRYYASTGLFRRELLHRMGLPHESVGIADWSLWLSVARHAPVTAVDEVLVDYRVHDQGFQVAQRSASLYSFWLDHWRLAQSASVRLHPDCAQCELALTGLRRLVSKRQLELAELRLRRGEFEPPTRLALRCAWQSQPRWFSRTGFAAKWAFRLVWAAAQGVWTRRLGRWIEDAAH